MKYQGSCHCGTVTFEVEAPFAPAARCNCSLCRRKGILLTAPFPEAALQITSGRDDLSVYQFNTRVAEHYFCRRCGIHTFNKTRKDSRYWRANIGCLRDVDPFAQEVTIVDGASSSVVADV
jgi:hypothetical protein